MNRRKKVIGSIILAAFLTLALAACAATGTGTTKQGVASAGEDLDDGGWALDASDFTGAEFAGSWQDKDNPKVGVHIANALEMNELNLSELPKLGGIYQYLDTYNAVYDVTVYWEGSESRVAWNMTAVAGAQDDSLFYENGSKMKFTHPQGEDAPPEGTTIWEKSSGYLSFDDDGYMRWYDDKEPEGAEYRFVKEEW